MQPSGKRATPTVDSTMLQADAIRSVQAQHDAYVLAAALTRNVQMATQVGVVSTVAVVLVSRAIHPFMVGVVGLATLALTERFFKDNEWYANFYTGKAYWCKETVRQLREEELTNDLCQRVSWCTETTTTIVGVCRTLVQLVQT